MYDIFEENKDYKQKWLEAERDLALMGIILQPDSPNYEPIIDVDKDMERVNESLLTPRNLEDYQPGATKTHVFEALKKVVKSRKSSRRHVPA